MTARHRRGLCCRPAAIGSGTWQLQATVRPAAFTRPGVDHTQVRVRDKPHVMPVMTSTDSDAYATTRCVYPPACSATIMRRLPPPPVDTIATPAAGIAAFCLCCSLQLASLYTGVPETASPAALPSACAAHLPYASVRPQRMCRPPCSCRTTGTNPPAPACRSSRSQCGRSATSSPSPRLSPPQPVALTWPHTHAAGSSDRNPSPAGRKLYQDNPMQIKVCPAPAVTPAERHSSARPAACRVA